MTQTCASVYKISPGDIYIPVRKREERKIPATQNKDLPSPQSCLVSHDVSLGI